MLYLSAQPAESYFLWQLEIQLQNFEDIGILPTNVHVVLSFKADFGIPIEFERFVKTNKQAQFFFYPDKRENPQYLSSIRPHILRQHFERFPELSGRIVCYHDSDIIFRERLAEKLLSDTDYWYFSDTRNYVGATYLKRFGQDFFEGLCRHVGIDPQKVEKNELHSGGAQHIMKRLTAAYWDGVEHDSEAIYTYIKTHNSTLEKHIKTAQAWCADMWAVLWTAWKIGKEVRLHDELLFSWPKDHISRYDKVKIFHNSGVFAADKSDYFCKLLFKESTPYHLDFSTIRKDYCSVKFVEQIERLAQRQTREVLNDCTLVMGIVAASPFQQERILCYIQYLYKHLDMEIHLVETGNWGAFNPQQMQGKCAYFLLSPQKGIAHHIKQKVKTKNFIYTDAHILLPVGNIRATAYILRREDKILVFPMHEVKDMTVFQYNIFKDTLTLDVERNHRKPHNNLIDYVESFAMSKMDYTRCGGDNHNWCYFSEDGFNLERQARARFLGYRVEKVALFAFKLFPNDRRAESKKNKAAENYLDLCEGTRDTLRRKIASGLYSFNKPYGRKVKVQDRRVGICALKPAISVEGIRMDLTTTTDVSIDDIVVDFNKPQHDLFKDALRQARDCKLEFLIVLCEDLLITTEGRESLWAALSIMNYYGLQLLSGVNGGGFKQERKLTNNLFWIDSLPMGPLMVIHGSLFNQILSCSMVQDKSIAANLNLLTPHIGTIIPFVGLPKAQNDRNEIEQANHRDRINQIKRVEDRLKWISAQPYDIIVL